MVLVFKINLALDRPQDLYWIWWLNMGWARLFRAGSCSQSLVL